MKKEELPAATVAELEKVENAAISLWQWIAEKILAWDTLQQIFISLFLVFIAWVFSRKVKSWEKEKTGADTKVSEFVARMRLPPQELAFIISLVLLFWLSIPLATLAGAQTKLLSIFTNLLSAWAFIRISSMMIDSGFWSKAVAFFLWTIAALNILDWIEPALKILDAAALNIGSLKISLLLIIRGIVIFTVFLWLASALAGWLERTLWKSDGLTPSQKVLFHKSARVALIALALLLGLNALGVDLTALAVFSGAVGIGIGLGLQKVFSNLLSGFILLMDKSIKPGDVIAVENTYGWVNRLGARYVSILTRDGKEHLIPNETLISERVENWSYSTTTIRIHVPVGVSYKSDIDLVKKILIDAAKNNSRVLKSHQPMALITGFGDNAIHFELRAWIEDPVNGVSNVTSSLYEAIWRGFRENHIEIPYPQRDIHLQTSNVEQILKTVQAMLEQQKSDKGR